MNSSLNKPRVEYYELRNVVGDLIDQQKDIENMGMGIKSTLIIIIASLTAGYTLFIFPTISKFVLIITMIFC